MARIPSIGASGGRAAAHIRRAARSRCTEVAEMIVEEIRRSPLTPVRDEAGEPSGALRAGYRVEQTAAGAMIVNDVSYWRFQEFGTRRMDANPHVRPAIETVRARLRA